MVTNFLHRFILLICRYRGGVRLVMLYPRQTKSWFSKTDSLADSLFPPPPQKKFFFLVKKFFVRVNDNFFCKKNSKFSPLKKIRKKKNKIKKINTFFPEKNQNRHLPAENIFWIMWFKFYFFFSKVFQKEKFWVFFSQKKLSFTSGRKFF